MMESELCEIGLPAILATRRVNGLQLRALSRCTPKTDSGDFSLSLSFSSGLRERKILLLQVPIYRGPDPDRGAERKAPDC